MGQPLFVYTTVQPGRTIQTFLDISGENPNPLYKARSGFSILTEECLTFRTTSPLRRVLADAHQENTIICFVPDHACHRHTRHLRRAMMLSPRADLRRIWSSTSWTNGLSSKPPPRTALKSSSRRVLSPSAPKPVMLVRANSLRASS